MKEENNNKRIKVLAIVCKLMPAGLENRLMDILRNIDRDRVQIDIYTYQLDEGVYDDEVRELGSVVYYNKPLTPQNMISYIGYFKKFLEEHPEYKIVHAHQDAWCSVFCKGAYLAGVPIRIAHSRTAISSLGLSYFVKNIIKLPTRKYANYYFAVSCKAARWLYGSKLFEQGKVQIWPNAIDANKFYFDIEVRKRVREENKWNNKYVIMHVGNITPPKNHRFILEIFNNAKEKDQDAILVLVGDGDSSFIKKYITEHQIEDSVYLLGSRHDVNVLLQGADVFLFPSIFEGLPGALVEAQASGLPCVISDTIANEVYITPDISVCSLNDGVDKWSKEVLNFRNYNRKNTKEYVLAKGFDVNSMTDKLCDFYEEVYKDRRF